MYVCVYIYVYIYMYMYVCTIVNNMIWFSPGIELQSMKIVDIIVYGGTYLNLVTSFGQLLLINVLVFYLLKEQLSFPQQPR